MADSVHSKDVLHWRRVVVDPFNWRCLGISSCNTNLFSDQLQSLFILLLGIQNQISLLGYTLSFSLPFLYWVFDHWSSHLLCPTRLLPMVAWCCKLCNPIELVIPCSCKFHEQRRTSLWCIKEGVSFFLYHNVLLVSKIGQLMAWIGKSLCSIFLIHMCLLLWIGRATSSAETKGKDLVAMENPRSHQKCYRGALICGMSAGCSLCFTELLILTLNLHDSHFTEGNWQTPHCCGLFAAQTVLQNAHTHTPIWKYHFPSCTSTAFNFSCLRASFLSSQFAKERRQTMLGMCAMSPTYPYQRKHIMQSASGQLKGKHHSDTCWNRRCGLACFSGT